MNTFPESLIIEQASMRSRLLCTTAGFSPDEVEDVRQDLIVDLLRRSPKFDSARGDLDGFAYGVMQNHATVLIARRRRRVNHEILVGDLREPDSEDVDDVLTKRAAADQFPALNEAIDVQRVLRTLPTRLQTLAMLLASMSITEVCAVTGKSRSRIFQLRREIRAAFVRAGLAPVRPRRARPRSGGGRA